MMNVKAAVSAALVAAASLAAAPAAFAVTDPAVAPSDLVLVLGNTTTNTSYAVDLGVSDPSLFDTTTFQNPAGYTRSWTIDTSSLGGQVNYFALYTAQPSTNAGGIGLTGTNAIVGLNVTGAGVPVLSEASMKNNLWNAMQVYDYKYLPGATTSFVGTNTVGGGYWGICPSNPGCTNSSYTVTALSGLGQATPGSQTLSLADYFLTSESTRTNASEQAIGNATGAGVFSFSGTTLTYNLAGTGGGAVPLPAAGWLLVSGLLGLGAVGRRREPVAG